MRQRGAATATATDAGTHPGVPHAVFITSPSASARANPKSASLMVPLGPLSVSRMFSGCAVPVAC